MLYYCMVFYSVVSAVYFYCKTRRRVRKKSHHSSPTVTYTRTSRSNDYDLVSDDDSDTEGDTTTLVKHKGEGKGAAALGDMSSDGIDITYRPSDSEEDDPVYEECSTNVKK